jgi:hypothetical protein
MQQSRIDNWQVGGKNVFSANAIDTDVNDVYGTIERSTCPSIAYGYIYKQCFGNYSDR